MEKNREVFLKKYFHEGEFQLKDSLDEFIVGRVEVVKEPCVIALKFGGHLLFSLMRAQVATIIIIRHREFNLEAVLLCQCNAKAFLFLLNVTLLALS